MEHLAADLSVSRQLRARLDAGWRQAGRRLEPGWTRAGGGLLQERLQVDRAAVRAPEAWSPPSSPPRDPVGPLPVSATLTSPRGLSESREN